MSTRRFASIASALLVAAIAFLASYSHMRHLSLRYGQDHVIATLLPISVDGMLVVATIALGDGRRHRWSAWVAFWTGVAASVVANVLAAQPSAIARCISAWPAVAFLLVVEVITRGARIRAATEPAHPTATAAVVPASPSPAEPATVADSVADPNPPTTPPRRRATAAPKPATKAAKEPANDTAKKVTRWHAKLPDATHAELAAKAGVSVRSVERYRPAKETANEADTAPANGTPVPDLIATD